MQRSRHGRATTSAYSANGERRGRARQRAYLVAALPDHDRDDLTELRELLRTAGVAAVGETIQHRDHPHPNTYIGSGKLDEVKHEIAAADANLVACDDELTPRQERNLESALGIPVIDRTAIILDIFASHAHTAEGKLQVELAQLEYNLARMRGLWSHLERLGGGIGTRGPGETQIETDRVERTRSSVGVGERLFHTLDPTTRLLKTSGRSYLVSDTVGFIRKLPHQLVDAFGATLEETRLADLILHVADASATEEDLLEMTGAVQDVLSEIGAGNVPQLLVLSKADLIDDDRRSELARRHAAAMLVSAHTGEGIDGLVERIEDEFARRLKDVELLIPYGEGGRLAELHEVSGDLKREDTGEGVRVRVRLPAQVAARYEQFTRDGHDGPAQ